MLTPLFSTDLCVCSLDLVSLFLFSVHSARRHDDFQADSRAGKQPLSRENNSLLEIAPDFKGKLQEAKRQVQGVRLQRIV
jgi:hypothetical protein